MKLWQPKMNEKCAFRRSIDDSNTCAYTGRFRLCWLCSDFMVRIPELGMKELYHLNEGRRGRRLIFIGVVASVVLSIIATVVSILRLAVSVSGQG